MHFAARMLSSCTCSGPNPSPREKGIKKRGGCRRKNGEWEGEVSSAEDGREWEHCCCLDFPLNEFGIIPETSGENIYMDELVLGRKGVYQLPQGRLMHRWLGSPVFSCRLKCESWNTMEKNDNYLKAESTLCTVYTTEKDLLLRRSRNHSWRILDT